MALIQALDDRECVISHQVKRTMVYHSLCQVVAKGTESRTFTRVKHSEDGNVAWKLLLDPFEGSTQRDPEAKMVRSFLKRLFLS